MAEKDKGQQNVIVLNRANWCQDMPNIVFHTSQVEMNYFSPWAKY